MSTWSVLLCVKSLLSTIRLDLYVVFLVLEHMRYAAGQRFFQSAALGFSANHQCAQVPLLWSMVKKRGLPSISHNRGTSWFEFAGHFFSKAWLVNELWLVVWNMNFIFPYIGNHNPNWRSHIFRGRYTTNQLWFMVDITCITIVFIGFINHFALFPIDVP